MPYSPETGEQILNTLKERGWNLYSRDRGSPEEVISRGPVDSLQTDIPYIALTKADDPKNPEQVFAAMEELALRLNREMPTIEVRPGISKPWTGFTLHEDEVKLHVPSGDRINYDEFLMSLGSVIQV